MQAKWFTQSKCPNIQLSSTKKEPWPINGRLYVNRRHREKVVVLTKWCPSPGKMRIKHSYILFIYTHDDVYIKVYTSSQTCMYVSGCACVYVQMGGMVVTCRCVHGLYHNMSNATCTHLTGEMSEAVVRAAITRALTRLGTTYIDLLQFHWYVLINRNKKAITGKCARQYPVYNVIL